MTGAMVDLPRSDRALRPSGIALTAVGGALALVGMSVLTWFTVTGPHVVHRLSQIPDDATGITTVVDPEAGRSHGLLVWCLFVAALLLALVAQLPLRPAAGTTARVLSPVIAMLLAIMAGLHVLGAHLLVTTDASLADATLRITPGFWVTLSGLTLLAVAGAIGPRRLPQQDT